MEKTIVDLPPFSEIAQEFWNGKYWGMSLALDLKQCNPEKIKDFNYIEKYIYDLCMEIEMRPHGTPMIEYFGEDDRIAGISFMQLIETSSMTGHFANRSNSAYIDIFSCKIYDPHKVIKFTAECFDAKCGYCSYEFRE